MIVMCEDNFIVGKLYIHQIGQHVMLLMCIRGGKNGAFKILSESPELNYVQANRGFDFLINTGLTLPKFDVVHNTNRMLSVGSKYVCLNK